MAKFVAWRSLPALAQPPLVVIDIGYSEASSSCGVWSATLARCQGCQFHLAANRVGAELNRLLSASQRPMLVVEAPLSRSHNSKGNPAARGPFEGGRRWYVQPGATTCLGAIRLLEILGPMLTGKVWIAEAFLSNKQGKSKHWHDAKTIFDQFWNGAPIEPSAPDCSPLCGDISGVPEVRVFHAPALLPAGPADGDDQSA